MKAILWIVGLSCFMVSGWCLEDGIIGVGDTWNLINWGLSMATFIVGMEAMKGVYE